MLSIFPPLLAFEGFAPLLLRIVLGLVFALWSYEKFKSKSSKGLAVFEGIIGVFLIVGFLTQLVAFIAAIVLGIRLFVKIKQKAFLTDGVNYYLILLVIAISLILTGSGFIAFDLPL